MKGAVVGFLAGAALGGIVGNVVGKEAENCDYCFNPSSRGELTLIVAGLGGALGAGVGAVVGRRQTDIWVPVAIPPAVRISSR
jgi:outer membrane lipoprotein SlyB